MSVSFLLIALRLRLMIDDVSIISKEINNVNHFGDILLKYSHWLDFWGRVWWAVDVGM